MPDCKYFPTFGDQRVDLTRISLRALVYSAWALLAAGSRSPSALFMIIESASSMMPFFMPTEQVPHFSECYIGYICSLDCGPVNRLVDDRHTQVFLIVIYG